jgi:TRAP-type C4-dicarboxylate transport system permease small subunit
VNRFGWFQSCLGGIAGLILFALMMLTFADVLARYVFNFSIRGAFELTEVGLLVLIFAGLPLVSLADEHVTMEFVDQWLPARLRGLLQRIVQLFCGALLLGLARLTWVKADKITAYGDTTDVLKIQLGPFVYFMSATIAIAGLIHLFRTFGSLSATTPAANRFDSNKGSVT